MATLSLDAVGSETMINVVMGGEGFHCKGIIIEKRNWLEVFHFEKWQETVLPSFTPNQEFKPSKLAMTEGQTTPPKHLTEADLISLMDKNGIGTDATIHEHIKHVQEREYVVKVDKFLIPTKLGICLVEVYEQLSIELYKPTLRAAMEADMKAIAEGQRTKAQVYDE